MSQDLPDLEEQLPLPLPMHSQLSVTDSHKELLAEWKTHENYEIGIRMADLATMWCVNGWAKSKFPEFVSWATSQLGVPSFGNFKGIFSGGQDSSD